LDSTRTSAFYVAKHEESDCRVASAHLRKDGEFVNFHHFGVGGGTAAAAVFVDERVTENGQEPRKYVVHWWDLMPQPVRLQQRASRTRCSASSESIVSAIAAR